MNPEAKFKRNIWYVLQKIQERNLHSQTINHITYVVSFEMRNPETIQPADEIVILKKLAKECKIIKIADNTNKSDGTLARALKSVDEIMTTVEDEIESVASSPTEKRIRLFGVEIIQPDFNKFYNEAESEIGNFHPTAEQKRGAGIEADAANNKALNAKLYLESDGDLWREPKTKYCYHIGELSDRYKIVRFLSENRGYQQTSSISSALDGKNKESIRKEINKINENFTEFIKLKQDKFIEGKKGSGYRVNPKYKINLK